MAGAQARGRGRAGRPRPRNPGQGGPAGEGSRKGARGRGSAGTNGRPPRAHPSSRRPQARQPHAAHRTARARRRHNLSARERRPPGAMRRAPRWAAAGPGRKPAVSSVPTHLSGRLGETLHRGDVPLHLRLAAPHRAADLAPRAREAGAEAHSSRRLLEPSA